MMAAERLGKSLAKVQGRMLAEILENAGTAQLATMLLHQWWDSPFSEPAASRFGTGAVFGVGLRTFDDVLWNCRSCCCVLLPHCVPPRVDVIITSPYIRCVQTAVAVREVLPSRRGGQASGPWVGRGLAIAFFNQFLATWTVVNQLAALQVLSRFIDLGFGNIELNIEPIQCANTLRQEFDSTHFQPQKNLLDLCVVAGANPNWQRGVRGRDYFEWNYLVLTSLFLFFFFLMLRVPLFFVPIFLPCNFEMQKSIEPLQFVFFQNQSFFLLALSHFCHLKLHIQKFLFQVPSFPSPLPAVEGGYL